MRGKFFIIGTIVFFSSQTLVAQTGIEQYCYLKGDGTTTQVQLVHVQTNKNWYVEGRYNYEEQNTGALYIGRTFMKEAQFSYSITPILGGVAGRLNGGSVGFNATADYHNIYFATQTQYTFSAKDETVNYFFSWSELGYQFRPWVYAGVACQQTNVVRTKTQLEPGAVLGFVVGKFTFPLYAFSPLSGKQYYVFGINLNIDLKNKRTR